MPRAAFTPRALTDHERVLLRWLLARSGDEARALLPQVDHARVVDRCACGCATIELAVEGRPHADDAMLEPVTPDHLWTEPNGGLCAVFVFAKGGTLAELEVYSVDGEATPVRLPFIEQLASAPDLPPAG